MALTETPQTDNFEARGEDELTLRRGDKVEVLELDDGFGDGWYLGKNVADNRSGLFPGGESPTVPCPLV
jgi:hypothetical protein